MENRLGIPIFIYVILKLTPLEMPLSIPFARYPTGHSKAIHGHSGRVWVSSRGSLLVSASETLCNSRNVKCPGSILRALGMVVRMGCLGRHLDVPLHPFLRRTPSIGNCTRAHSSLPQRVLLGCTEHYSEGLTWQVWS